MKIGTIAIILAGLVVVAGIIFSFNRGTDFPRDTRPPSGPRPDFSPGIVHVDDLAKIPERFTGEIMLRGVVFGVNESDHVFGIIDSGEFESCGVLTCAEILLPVRFSGDLPKPSAVVNVKGRVVRGDEGLIIEAKGVEV